MIRLNVHEAKTHLSRYLARLEAGESILLCRRNTPIAEIRPLPPTRRKKRPLGLAKNALQIHPSFFDELPVEVLREFEGRER